VTLPHRREHENCIGKQYVTESASTLRLRRWLALWMQPGIIRIVFAVKNKFHTLHGHRVRSGIPAIVKAQNMAMWRVRDLQDAIILPCNRYRSARIPLNCRSLCSGLLTSAKYTSVVNPTVAPPPGSIWRDTTTVFLFGDTKRAVSVSVRGPTARQQE
jgi:hypothetical protein